MQNLLAASLAGAIPEIQWKHGDDLCDCQIQNIGWWTNPYSAHTVEVRFCCLFKELAKEYPGLIREFSAFTDYRNGNIPVTEPMEWNSEDEPMPKYLWYRHMAAKHGRPISEVRDRLRDQEPPRAVPGPGARTRDG